MKPVMSRRLVAKGVAASMALPLVGARAAESAHKLVFAHTFSPETEQSVVTGIDVFKKLAEQYAGGALTVDVHDSGRLGGQNVLPQKLQYGAIQGCQLSMQNFAPFSESFNLLDFPYLFPSNAALERVLESDWFVQSKLAREAESKGFKVLPGMWANAGYRVLGLNRKVQREVRVPADLKGLKIRVNPTRVEQFAWSMTSASQATIAWSEAYQAMEQGIVDGLNVGLGPIAASRINETLSSVTLTEMNFNAHVTLLSLKWYRQLPSKVRDAIDRAAKESWEHQKTQQKAANARILEDWKRVGVKVIVPGAEEKRAWVRAIGHTKEEWNALKDRYGRSEYDRLYQMANA